METMRRVLRHVRRIVDGARSLGFTPAFPEFGPHLEPTDDDRRDVVRLDQQSGGLPAALRACMSVVGAVDLSGDCPPLKLYYYDPEWDENEIPIYPDPLALPSVRQLRDVWDVYYQPGESFRFDFAPDDIHKANTSGDVQVMVLPSLLADPVIENVRGRAEITLVEYLRLSVAWGGCPGWRFAPEHSPAALEPLRAAPEF